MEDDPIAKLKRSDVYHNDTMRNDLEATVELTIDAEQTHGNIDVRNKEEKNEKGQNPFRAN